MQPAKPQPKNTMNSVARLKKLVSKLKNQDIAVATHRAELEAMEADNEVTGEEGTTQPPSGYVGQEEEEAFSDDDSDMVPLTRTSSLPPEPIEADDTHGRCDSGIVTIGSRRVSLFSEELYDDDEPDFPLHVHKCETPWPHQCLPQWVTWEEGRKAFLKMHFAHMEDRRTNSDRVLTFRENKLSSMMSAGHGMGNGRSSLSNELKPEDID